MIDYVSKAVELGRGKTLLDLDTDEVLTLALTRLVEVLGEAATRIPSDLRDAHTAIPWREMIGMRNVLIHGYDVTSTDVLHAVVTRDLPPLVADLESLLASLPQDPS